MPRNQQVSRDDFTADEIVSAFNQAGGNIPQAAVLLSELGRGTVSRQLCRYWSKQLSLLDDGEPTAPLVGPKILVLDIETAPILAHVWRTFKENVGLEQISFDWYILSFAAKWLHQSETMYFDQQHARDVEDDTDLMRRLWNLLDEADIIVAHNGRRFDLKKINARFAIKGFTPPSPYRIVDTLEIAKKNFAFTSNRLAYLTDTLCTEKKEAHAKFPGFSLWKECLAGNPEAWEEMRTYNIQDVVSLEELYLLLLPWDNKAPNVANYSDEGVIQCAKCGGKHLRKVEKLYRTNVGQYEMYLCMDCHGWNRGRKLQNSLEQRRMLLSGV